ncbi:hypothetical protein U7230_14360 [Carboxydochorda subterranea]|uniref:Uncharacterized protein n=1 Tax=Carboxydichorda subterranea TaxID=3109565 RepID=A0ABZ1BWQ9_9FIRM|nr:hypothetical protein [Limnochorda sp. L945t]WRP17244.1 hypothetical protein U7230_14360 [Limnochorda sp. L945t]
MATHGWRAVAAAVLVSALAVVVPAPAAGAAEVAGPFDPADFGVPLGPEEQQQLSGEWWPIAVGAAIGAVDGAYSYARSCGYHPRSGRYWTGMAAAALVGGGLGAINGSIQVGMRAARAGLQAGYSIYSWARTKVVNEISGRAWSSWSRHW